MAGERDIAGAAAALRHHLVAAIAEDVSPAERERAKVAAEAALRLLEFVLLDINRIAAALEAIAAKTAAY